MEATTKRKSFRNLRLPPCIPYTTQTGYAPDIFLGYSMIYFSWIEQYEEFTEKDHLRHDIPLVSLSITQKEHSPPQAEAYIYASHPFEDFAHHSWGIFSYKSPHELSPAQCLLKGKLHSVSSHKENIFLLVFTVTSLSVEDTLKTMEQTKLLHNDNKTVQDLFYGDPPAIEHMLTLSEYALHWHRATGVPSLSHGLDGTHHHTITHEELFGLSYTTHTPITEISLSVQAQWIQNSCGTFDLFPLFAQEFPEKRVNSYTPFHQWPQWADEVGADYTVAYSTLIFCPPPQALPSFWASHTHGILLEHLIKSPHNPHKKIKERLWLKRFWFQGELALFWNVSQKREETISAVMNSMVQNPEKKEATALSFFLQKIPHTEDIPFWRAKCFYPLNAKVEYKKTIYTCTEEHLSTECFSQDQWTKDLLSTNILQTQPTASFFLTSLGYKAFDFALERAQSLLFWGARCFHITLRGGMESLAHITLDHSLTIHHSSLPLGSATGKVISYSLSATEKKQEVEIVVACSIGKAPLEKKERHPPQGSYSHGYAEARYHIHLHEFCHAQQIEYQCYDDQYPTDFHATIEHASPRDMVQKIHITNLPAAQEEYVFSLVPPYPKNPLKDRETSLHITLKKLGGLPCIQHTITPVLCNAYYPHKGVELSTSQK